MHGQPNPQGNNESSHPSPYPYRGVYGSGTAPQNMFYNQSSLTPTNNAYYIASQGYGPLAMPPVDPRNAQTTSNWDPEIPDITYESGRSRLRSGAFDEVTPRVSVAPTNAHLYERYQSPRPHVLDQGYTQVIPETFVPGSSLAADPALSPSSSTATSLSEHGNFDSALGGGDDEGSGDEAVPSGRPKQPRRVIEERSRDKVKIAITGLKDLLTRHGFPPHQTARRANFLMHATAFIRRVLEERNSLKEANQGLRRELENMKRERDQYARYHMAANAAQGGPYPQYPRTH